MISTGLGLKSDSPFHMIFVEKQQKSRATGLLEMAKFKNTFKCTSTISLFTRYLEQCYSAFHSKLCYSPYFVMAQSSGTGKTRLLLESSRNHPVVFINCLAVQNRLSSDGFQFMMKTFFDDRTAWTKEGSLLSDFILKKAQELSLFFCAISFWVLQHLLSIFQDGKFCISSAAEAMREMTGKLFQSEFSKGIWSEIIDIYETNKFNFEELWDEHSKAPYFPWLKSRIITLAFDEASILARDIPSIDQGLALPLRIIRRAAKLYPTSNNCLAFILSGTSSKLANFVVSYKFEASSRESINSFRLFPPFVMKFQDSYVTNYTQTLMTDQSLFQKILDRPNDHNFYFLGRPLWGAEMEISNQPISSIVDLAKSKLSGPADGYGWFGVLLVRIAIQVNPVSRVVDDLVAVNMAALQAFNHEENALLISYVSEPILALAASKLLEKPVDDRTPSFRHNVFRSLSSVRKFEMADVGSRGEYVFQLICMDYVDIITGHNPVHPILLQQFILHVFGEETLKMINHSKTNIDKCLLSLLQFKYFEYQLDLSSLKIALIRGLGIVSKTYNRGFDICIPFIYPNNEVSGLFIEVKNCESRFSDPKKISNFNLAVSRITKNSIKILVNLRRGRRITSEFPTCSIIPDGQIFHVDFLCTGSRCPEEYIRLLETPTKYSQIVALRKESMIPFLVDNQSRDEAENLDSFLDLGLTCLPVKEYLPIMESVSDEIVPAARQKRKILEKAFCNPKKTTFKKTEKTEETVLPAFAAGEKQKISEAKGKAPVFKKPAASKGMAPAAKKVPAAKKPVAVKGKALPVDKKSHSVSTNAKTALPKIKTVAKTKASNTMAAAKSSPKTTFTALKSLKKTIASKSSPKKED